jgi:hypothetical protein
MTLSWAGVHGVVYGARCPLLPWDFLDLIQHDDEEAAKSLPVFSDFHRNFGVSSE